MGSTARAAIYITAGRTVGFAALFVVPLVIARYLTLDEFGIYRYFFLLYGTFSFMQLGMAESLYYFIPQARERAGAVIANAVVSLVVSGAVTALVFFALPGLIAPALGKEEIEPWLPLVGLFLALMVVSAPLEIIMISVNQPLRAAFTYAGADVTRALLLLVPAVLTRSVGAILAGATLFAALRCIAMGVYLFGHFRAGLHIDWRLLRTQLAYALPFTAAVIVEFVQFNLHQYVVAARFSEATFAIYSVGCMQIPLVDLLAMSTANVMMVRMNEQRAAGQAVVGTWLSAVERLALIFVPLVVALVLTARELFAVLYPATFAPSVPIFVIATGLIALAALPVDGALRVFAQTRYLLVMNVLRLALIAGGISWAISSYDLRGAIAITVVAQALAKLLALGRIRALFEVRWRDVLPWRALAIIAGAAGAAAWPAAWVYGQLSLPPLAQGAITAVVYGSIYLLLIGAWRSPVRTQVARHLGWQGSSPTR